jgi:hypothetical protein
VGAGRHPCGVGAWAMQEEEDEDWLGADGGVLGLCRYVRSVL